MTALILFVCTANVCRSPSAQAVALTRLRADELEGQIAVQSAGTRVEDGRGWCSEARKHVSMDAETSAVMDRHEARRLPRTTIGQAALVVTADRQTSAHVVRLDPGARPRLFTMREAATLSRKVVEATFAPAVRVGHDRPLDVRPIGGGAGVESRLQWLVEEMDAARGRVSLLSERRTRHLFHSKRVTVLDVDIVDAHVKTNRAIHRRTLPVLTSGVGEMMAHVSYVLGHPEV
jgi:protein-tyrosine-phosphatase